MLNGIVKLESRIKISTRVHTRKSRCNGQKFWLFPPKLSRRPNVRHVNSTQPVSFSPSNIISRVIFCGDYMRLRVACEHLIGATGGWLLWWSMSFVSRQVVISTIARFPSPPDTGGLPVHAENRAARPIRCRCAIFSVGSMTLGNFIRA